MSTTVRLWRIGCVALVMALAACAEAPDDAAPVPPEPIKAELDACGGQCTDLQLCVADEAGKPLCANLCANQFHCWSGCCRPEGDTGYNVCRPTNVCFPSDSSR
jgi:hypothetical protein